VIKDNNISFENYQHHLKNNEFAKLKTQSKQIQQSYVRYALVDFLVEKFYWNYWMVITFGFNPSKDQTVDTLRASHFHFDRWLLTNNKLNSMPIEMRSKWVCAPEKGNEGHLHYNCFLQLPLTPDVKTYQSEWDAIRVSLRNIFRKLEKELPQQSKINFEIHERKRKVDILKTAMYSTKEMREGWMEDHYGEDHFANTILSWKDWGVIPINRHTPKNKQLITIPKVGALDEFMS